MGEPLQVVLLTVTEATTETCEVRGALVLPLVAVETGMVVCPEEANPMAEFALVQLKVVFATGLLNEMALD